MERRREIDRGDTSRELACVEPDVVTEWRLISLAQVAEKNDRQVVVSNDSQYGASSGSGVAEHAAATDLADEPTDTGVRASRSRGDLAAIQFRGYERKLGHRRFEQFIGA